MQVNKESRFAPSLALKRLMDEVQHMTAKHTKIDFPGLIMSVPTLLISCGLIELSTEDSSALKSTPMSDAWLCDAAQLPTASGSSLKRLAKDVDRNGFASIEAADLFCAIELTREQKAFAILQKNASKDLSSGVALLASRVQSLGIEATLEEALENGKQYVAELAQTGLGVVTLATESAIWIGKGMGVVAGAMKDIRKNAG